MGTKAEVTGNRLHPLHTAELIHGWVLNTGTYPDLTRCTGRTTARALYHIHKAIQNPFQWLDIRDHHDSTDAHRRLRVIIQDMVTALKLEHFYFRADKLAFGEPAQ